MNGRSVGQSHSTVEIGQCRWRERDCIVKVLLRTHYPYSGTEEIMETKLVIIKEMERNDPLGIASYEDKIVQMAVKKILGAIYEPRFLNCMYGFRPNRGCHEAIKEVYQRISHGKISYIVDAISKVSLTISTMIG